MRSRTTLPEPFGFRTLRGPNILRGPRILRGLLLVFAAFGLLVASAFADVLFLKDGRRIEGVILSETAKVVRLETRLGELEFKVSEIDRIERGKTKLQEFKEGWAKAKTAEEFFELGQWAESKRMRKETRKAMKQAVKLDPKHAGANGWLGFVEYRGDWIAPEERERRMAADKVAEMRALGLVRYGERWVTPDERDKLEAGLVLFEGKWIPFEQAQRAKGLEEYRGKWISRVEAIALTHCAEAELKASASFGRHLNAEALIAGIADDEFLASVGDGILVGRKWFNEVMKIEPGLALLADRLGELYVFSKGDQPYQDTVEYFASLTPTLPEGWSAAAAKSHGFFWTDPYALSSARRRHRGMDGLEGHCYHHWGHMLLNRLSYDGRLLPPWYDEAFAALMEFRIHERNAVFCRSRSSGSTGTIARHGVTSFDPKRMREGQWRRALKEALEANKVLSIDRLAQRDFSDLEIIDIATGMGILEWIESHGEGALFRFHQQIREAAPEVPWRLIRGARERMAANDAAFQAATGMGWVKAEKAWRSWFLSR